MCSWEGSRSALKVEVEDSNCMAQFDGRRSLNFPFGSVTLSHVWVCVLSPSLFIRDFRFVRDFLFSFLVSSWILFISVTAN